MWFNKLKMMKNQRDSWVNFSIVSKEIKEGQKYVLIPKGEHAKLQAENKELQKKLADIVKAGVVVNGFRIIGDLETINKGVSKYDLVPEGEYAKLRKTMELHVDDICSLNNELEFIIDKNENLENDITKLTTALNECYSTIAALEKGNEELKFHITTLKRRMSSSQIRTIQDLHNLEIKNTQLKEQIQIVVRNTLEEVLKQIDNSNSDESIMDWINKELRKAS